MREQLRIARVKLAGQKRKTRNEAERKKLEHDIKYTRKLHRRLKYRKLYKTGRAGKRVASKYGRKTHRLLTSKKAKKIYRKTGRSIVKRARKLFK